MRQSPIDARHLPFARRDLYIMVVLAALAIIIRLLPGPRTIDDAFITFRYARNIVNGVGFVYNPGELVLGTTTPLYTLLLAMLGGVGGSADFPAIAPVLNALADGVSGALLYLIARRLLGHAVPGLAAGLLWAVAPRSVAFAIGGMETSVYVALMLGAFVAWLWDRTLLASALAGLSTLARPDALIWAGPLALAMLWQSWSERSERPLLARLPWREGGVYLAVLLPWLIYGTLVFGSPLTRSMTAKVAAYVQPWYTALATFAVNYGVPFFEHETLGNAAVLVGSLLYPILAVVGGVALARRDRRFVPIAVFPWLCAAVFALVNIRMFNWYLVPPMAIYTLCIIAGVWVLAIRVLGQKRAPWAAPLALGMVAAVWLVFSLRDWELHPGYGQYRPTPHMAWNEAEILQEQVGQMIAARARPDAVIAAGDIGAIGWGSNLRILDTVGLISPQATPYYPVDADMLGESGYAVAPDLVFDLKPDYISLMESYGDKGLFIDPRFEQQYRLIAEYPIEVGHSTRLLVYERIE
jgi:Gpi18-like mannosyltransferase